MYNLNILAIHDPASGLEDKEILDPTDYETSSQAELRALRWLTYCPNDIVMLDTSLIVRSLTCLHCNEAIVYRPQNHAVKWAHANGGYYACFPDGATQATPKEEV